jgi:hypothetical protein
VGKGLRRDNSRTCQSRARGDVRNPRIGAVAAVANNEMTNNIAMAFLLLVLLIAMLLQKIGWLPERKNERKTQSAPGQFF